jgi:hypothetical protein
VAVRLTTLRYEVLRAITVKIIAFWDVMPCSLADVYRSFGRAHCLHLLGKWSQHVPSKHQGASVSLHGVISQKIVSSKIKCLYATVIEQAMTL